MFLVSPVKCRSAIDSLNGSQSVDISERVRAKRFSWVPGLIALLAFVYQKGLRAGALSKPVEHWAFAPLARVEPAADGLYGSGNPIDRFVLQTLRAKKLEPVRLAGKATLVRRIYFDLIGLPPTPQELNYFLSDPASDAWFWPHSIQDEFSPSVGQGNQWSELDFFGA